MTAIICTYWFINRKHSSQAVQQDANDSTIRETHNFPKQSVAVPNLGRSPVSVSIPIPSSAASPVRSNLAIPALQSQQPQQPQQPQPQPLSQPPHGQAGGQYNAYRGMQPVPIRLPQPHGSAAEVGHSPPLMNGGRGFPAVNMANREQFFASNSMAGQGSGNGSSCRGNERISENNKNNMIMIILINMLIIIIIIIIILLLLMMLLLMML